MLTPVSLINFTSLSPVNEMYEKKVIVTERKWITYDELDSEEMHILSSEEPHRVHYILWSKTDHRVPFWEGEKLYV